jgi:hypothetical protein
VTIRPNRAYTHTLSVGALNQDGTYAGCLLDGAGTLALRKVGSGKMTLTGATLYSATNIVVSGGTLALANSDALDDAAVVVLSSGGQVSLAEGVDEVIGRLFLGGVRQLAGTYGSTSSPAQVKNDTYFSGTGVLRIIPYGTLMQLQ